MDNLVLLNVGNLWPRPELLKHTGGEATGVTVDVAIIDLVNARDVPNERVGMVESVKEVQVAKLDIRVNIVLENDDIRVVQGAMGVLAGKEGRKTYCGALGDDMGRGREGGRDDDGGTGDGYQNPVKERRHDGTGRRDNATGI